MGVDKNSFSKEIGLYPNRNSESHMNKWKHTQTSLDTLGTNLERLGSKAEASTKELEQQRRRLRPTVSTGTSDRVTLCLTEPHRDRPGTSDWVNLPPSGHLAQETGSPGTAQKTAREFTPNFRSMDLPNHLES
jgi:hypothetical protein